MNTHSIAPEGPAGDDEPLPHVAAELDALAACIAQVRSELRHLSDGQAAPRAITTAHDELDAVIAATEDATGQILDACEKIEAAASQAAVAVSDGIIEQVTRVYEACSFQDITGQRISKVVSALKEIEGRVNVLVELVAPLTGAQAPAAFIKKNGAGYGSANRTLSAEEREQGLLEGPQLPGQGIDQAEIDKLLAGNG